jgi:hypothetical protein
MPGAPWLDLLDAPGYTGTIVRLEFDVARRFTADRSTFGGVLKLPVEISQGFSGTPLMLAGWLRVAGEAEGLAIPAQSIIMNENSIRIPISDDQIARFEEKRAGAEPTFELMLRGLAGKNGLVSAVSATSALYLVVPLPEWLKVLDQLGYGRRRLIELPAIPIRDGAAWRAALNQIEAAARRLRTADSGAAITEARTAVQRTLDAAGASIGRPPVKGESFRPFAEEIAKLLESMHQDKSDDPYKALADGVRLAISCFGFASETPHVGFSYAEMVHAELVLSVATTIYTYFARTLK